MNDFDPLKPELKFVQDDKNNCVLIILDYALFAANEHVVEHAVVSRL